MKIAAKAFIKDYNKNNSDKTLFDAISSMDLEKYLYSDITPKNNTKKSKSQKKHNDAKAISILKKNQKRG